MSNGLDFIPQFVKEKLAHPESTKIALVGASNNPEKYGNIILKNLTSKGYNVIPINPKESTIEGKKVYPNVWSVPDKIDIINMVVPPKVSLAVVKQLAEHKVDVPIIWFQDGSFDDAVIQAAKGYFDYVVYNACIMIVTNYFALPVQETV